MSSIHPTARRGYSSVQKYKISRPNYLRCSLEYIWNIYKSIDCRDVDSDKLNCRWDIIELGSGPGNFTLPFSELVEPEVSYLATEPLDVFVTELSSALSSRNTFTVKHGYAAEIQATSDSAQMVIAAQSFHWFATVECLVEIARVLIPGGVFCCIWTAMDEEKTPWVAPAFNAIRKLAIETETPQYILRQWQCVVGESNLFDNKTELFLESWTEARAVSQWIDYFSGVSLIAALQPEAREVLLQRIRCEIVDIDESDSLTATFRSHIYYAKKTVKSI